MDVQGSVQFNISQLDADQCVNPYQDKIPSDPTAIESSNLQYISICAADIAHLLEKLKPQVLHTSSPFDPFLISTQAAFNLQYARVTTRYDRLCRRILESIEPGQSSKNVHPCQEDWALLLISVEGNLSPAITSLTANKLKITEDLGDLDPAQDAALCLADTFQPSTNSKSTNRISVDKSHASTLSEMFADKSRTSHIKTDSLTSLYWHKALGYLQSHYPLTVLTGNDTKVLGPLVQKIDGLRLQLTDECLSLEQEVAGLEATYASAQADLVTASSSLNKLRTKLWYSIYVIGSDHYQNARNITVALNNMAIPALGGDAPAQEQLPSPEPSRPGTSATSASSVFDQPRIDTETIMKAPVDHGGPRKLSDVQIEKTKKWLERNNVENFCRGEERIHRFCMEVKLLTRRLVGDTFTQSPVLWSSELFAREKTLYDIHAGMPLFSGLPSTRAPSVMSEPLSSTSFPIRAPFAGSRASIFGGSSRYGGLGSDVSSFISSPGRATTTTSTTLESSIWSPAQSNSPSVTSVSLPSRPPSTFESSGMSRTIDRSQERNAFLENLRQDLSSLLLSDLACPVWSCGSESDAWMNAICQTPTIASRLHQRSTLAHLLPSSKPAVAAANPASGGPGRHKRRSHSTAPPRTPSVIQDLSPQLLPTEKALSGSGESRVDGFPYPSAFADILCRMRDHTDPIRKLRAIRDFKLLSLDFQRSQQTNDSDTHPDQSAEHADTDTSARRRSLDPSVLLANLRRQRQKKTSDSVISSGNREGNVVVKSLKDLLLFLRPKTIFRDLQYVAVFASSESLDDAELGQAFIDVGLAALAWKDEVCRAMVDVADRIVAKDSIKRNTSNVNGREPSVLKAMEYWIIGAQEGNAIAQRELASLYLTHPDVPPIISLPLALSSDIFKKEMMWEGEGEARTNPQALCLALHWMQEASKNKDAVAQTKLREREAGHSIR